MMSNLPIYFSIIRASKLIQNWQCHVFHGSDFINEFSRVGFLRPGMVLGAQRCGMDPLNRVRKGSGWDMDLKQWDCMCVCVGDRMQIALK